MKWEINAMQIKVEINIYYLYNEEEGIREENWKSWENERQGEKERGKKRIR